MIWTGSKFQFDTGIVIVATLHWKQQGIFLFKDPNMARESSNQTISLSLCDKFGLLDVRVYGKTSLKTIIPVRVPMSQAFSTLLTSDRGNGVPFDSGFRRGELSGLTWDNIDFDNHIITIDKALYYTKAEGIVLDTPKTETSQRSLKLPEAVFHYLRKLRDFYADEAMRLDTKWEGNNFVFRNESGGVLSPLSPNSWLHKFCEREGLRYVNIHSFRHLNASLLIDSGASVKTVQACMGHSMASTTLNIYAHSFRRSQAIASEAVAENFNLL